MTDLKSPSKNEVKTIDTAINRRNLIKASAGVGVLATAGSTVLTSGSGSSIAHAQEVDGTRAQNWDEAESINTNIKLQGEGWVTLQTEFPFWALGFGWDIGEGTWPAIQYGISMDGVTWDDGFVMNAHSDGGPPARDNRHHTDLHFADGQQYIRYRTIDGEGNLVVLDRFQVTYIDPTDGPWEKDRANMMMRSAAVNDDTLVPPSIISRAQWGANESLRFDGTGEVWPPEYQTVEHAIVHHAAVNYGSDGYNAVRSIYYYHAITQGWGDIGYNYVVDVNGNIFEGRVGGANVIGGHAFEYANGSSGICVMGDFTSVDPPFAAKVALANIIAFVTRDLNPFATKPFHAAPALPTICAHRDVNQSSCPGNALYDDLPWIRNTVKSTLDQGLLDSQMPGGIVPGDWVKIQTENATPLPMRSQPGTQHLVVASIPYGTRVEVERGPLADSQYNWYLVHFNNRQGWVPANYLLVDPPVDEPTDGYTFGQNLRMSASTPLRSTPGGSVTGNVSAGAWAFIMAGAITTAGNTWFQIRTENNGDGWVPRSTITLAPVYNPVARFPVGSSVITTTAAPMRVRPGIAQTTDGSVSSGRTLQVSVAPIAVTDRIWYGVYGGTGVGGGWIEEGHLRAGPGNVIVVGRVSAPGQRFRVTEAVTLRNGPGTGNPAITTLAGGVMGTVIGGPITGNGYTWWQVRTDSNQQGWVAADFIEQIRIGSGDLSGYGIGVQVRTNTTVNLRSDAGTGYPIASTLNANTNGIIVDGPRISTGYTWWQIRTAAGRLGWVAQTYLIRTSGVVPDVIGIHTSIHIPSAATRRRNPGNVSSGLPNVPAGTYAAVIGGPLDAGAYRWWNVQYGSETGWVPQPSIRAANKFSAGDSIRSTARVQKYGVLGNVSTIGVFPVATHAAVLSGPRWFGSRLWYQVLNISEVSWVPQDWLISANKFTLGAGVRTTARVTSYGVWADESTRGALPADTYAVVVGAPRYQANRLWYFLRYDGSNTAWVPQDWLEEATRFAIGTGVRSTSNVMMYGNLGVASTIGTLPGNTYAVVVGGMRSHANRIWYLLRYNGSQIGWVPQDWLEEANQFTIGTGVRSTDKVMMYGTLGNGITIGTLPANVYAVVVGAPRSYANRIWYFLRYNGSQTGWVPQDWLETANQFTASNSVVSTDRAMMYGDLGVASTAGAIPANTWSVVISGPGKFGNRIWYKVRYDKTTGWVPQDWLLARNKFFAGNAVRTTSRVQAWGIVGNSSTETVIEADTVSNVVGGPLYANYRLWYRLTADGSPLWAPQEGLEPA